MNTRTTPPGGLSGMLNNAQLAWRLLRDDRVPTFLKVLVPLAITFYFVMPIDFVPDFIPLLGQLDDLGVVLLGMSMFIKMAPREVVKEHRVSMGLEHLPPPSFPETPYNPEPPYARPPEVIEGSYRSKERK